MRVTFREAKKTDLSLIKKFTVETGWKSIPESQRKNLDRETWSKHMVKAFESFFKREKSQIFVAENENHAFLGYLFVGETTDTMIGQSYGFIYDIYVKKEFRGKGIGKTLMEKAETHCRERGYSKISLMVSTSNQPAIRLYNRMGFKAEQMFMGKQIN